MSSPHTECARAYASSSYEPENMLGNFGLRQPRQVALVVIADIFVHAVEIGGCSLCLVNAELREGILDIGLGVLFAEGNGRRALEPRRAQPSPQVGEFDVTHMKEAVANAN